MTDLFGADYIEIIDYTDYIDFQSPQKYIIHVFCEWFL